MIRSKFRLWVLLPVLLILFFIFLSYELISTLTNSSDGKTAGVVFFIAPFFAFVLLWLIAGELRTKAIKVIINGEEISVKNFAGIGTARSFSFSEFDGYKISILTSRQGEYEYLYLIKNNKKAVKLSQYYHRNYKELKQHIATKTKDLGFE